MLKILRFIPVQLCFFLIVGILFGSNFLIEPQFTFPILLGLLVCLIISKFISNKRFNQSFHFNSIVYLFVTIIGFTLVSIQNKRFYENYYSHKIDEKNAVIIRVVQVLKPTNFHNKYVVTIESLNGENVFGSLLLNLEKDEFLNFRVDTRIFLVTEFEEVNKPLNPYYFDYHKYLDQRGIYHQISHSRDEVLEVDSNYWSLKGKAELIRLSINSALKKQGFQEDELAVMNALLLGQRNEVSKDLLQSYANAGAIHILALSGLHVGIILLLLNFLLRPIERLKYGKTIKLVLILVFLWSFAFMAGMSPSIIRAVTMFTAVAIGWQSKRPTNVFHSLVMSMFVLLLFRPIFLFEVGFQLSYLAVYSIVLLQPILNRIWNPPLKVFDYFWKLLTVSMAAQVGILPLSLYYFHQFPGLFFLSNLIIIPSLGFILGCGFLIIVLSLFNILPKSLFILYENAIRYMNYIVEWIAHQESFLFQEIPMSFLKMLSCYLLLVALIVIIRKWNYIRLVLGLISILVFQGVLIYEKRITNKTKEWIVFHKSKESMIGKRIGQKAFIHHSLDSTQINNENILKQYKLGIGEVQIHQTESIPRINLFSEKTVLIIDSLGLYNLSSLKPNILILTQSPKVNLNRVIKTLNPDLIIADGSNYKSYVAYWEQTCEEQKTPFHYTGQKGAYILRE